ncbi:hypothetical protein [Lactiplantibacillus mudanjiangensis]|uniref:Uncharacterized protein n=1 Tax=Lactiplantibacillus mudanjiangensis TaxID=1296538 RepID=A0A660DUH5_9LACO|nr:hypothetical protein [Lactiplantibacillus mudanjiangensis]VDG20335.1 hypothetical protein MUDAN_BIHEEGNE_01951 [Lactiplantibacillus mudanjiangensis]VDG23973.1 hypothetical protein MUDAN_IGPPGNFN_00593 [Lactiplantibacillus mudanjiangensis]VDG27156.1 hypothetical protein MUDAN_MDHGFNIF_02131 [Lactiplantibacillus mudanjiangensis]VDG33941.1 hypothetical protein MUDAN_DOGOELCO_03061 [Lactiplantibacillus mudanjiangensis]
MNKERKLIYVILNDEDVDYDLEEQPDQYVVYIRQQNGDTRALDLVNTEIKKLFDDADLNYQETVKPANKKADIVLTVQRS